MRWPWQRCTTCDQLEASAKRILREAHDEHARELAAVNRQLADAQAQNALLRVIVADYRTEAKQHAALEGRLIASERANASLEATSQFLAQHLTVTASERAQLTGRMLREPVAAPEYTVSPLQPPASPIPTGPGPVDDIPGLVGTPLAPGASAYADALNKARDDRDRGRTEYRDPTLDDISALDVFGDLGDPVAGRPQ